jgi:hemerythrin-like domain-containing protein
MQHTSLQTIKNEHACLSSMLHSMRVMLERGPKDQPEQFFDVLRAMLFYIAEFPECQHHPKESSLLFPRVAQVSPQISETIEQLERDHANGEKSVRELQHLLLAWELLGEIRRPRFTEPCFQYIHFYLEHMRLEEAVILPAAQAALSAQEWQQMDAAFANNRDPLSDKCASNPAYARLFTRIVMHAPTPIGVGHS